MEWILKDRGYYSANGWVEPGQPFTLPNNERPPRGATPYDPDAKIPDFDKLQGKGKGSASTMSSIATGARRPSSDRFQPPNIGGGPLPPMTPGDPGMSDDSQK